MSKSKINQSLYTTGFGLTLFALLCISICLCCVFLPKKASAQASMSGGGYTLNGGLTVFTGESSGAGYTLGPNGDPVAPNASGGGYTLEPTPYSPAQTNNGGGGSVSSGGAGGGAGVGYTYYPTSTATSVGPYPEYPDPGQGPGSGTKPGTKPGTVPGDTGTGFPTFDTNASSTGVQWIDTGTGIDTDFDGVPDIGGTTDGKAPIGPDGKPLIKKYSNTLSTFESVIAILFIAGFLFARVIRKKEGELDVYIVSRIPFAIYIDMILALHRGQKLGETIFPDEVLMSRLNANHYSTLNLIDLILMPVITAFLVIIIWPISYILALVILALGIIRYYIGAHLR